MIKLLKIPGSLKCIFVPGWLLLTILMLIPSHFSFAQSSSPFSRIGLGDIEYSFSARRLGMGQIGVAVSDADFINIFNPASLNKLTRTRIETGIDYRGSFLNGNNQNNYYGKAEFSGFTLAFPVSSDYGVGVAAGIIPYSNVSYQLVQDGIDNLPSGDKYKIHFEGKGGLSKLFIGGSYKLPFNLIAGAAFNYYFGNLDYLSRAEFASTNILQANYQKIYSPHGLGATIGLISPDFSELLNSETITDFRIGASFDIINNLKTDTLFTSTSNLVTDTLSVGKTTLKVPVRFSFGLSLILSSRFLLSLDYVNQPWSQYRFNGQSNSYLRNAAKLSTGFEFRPLREPGSTFLQLIIWRAGLSYEQTQYIVNGTGINQYSVSGGFSLPLSYENTLDLGLQYAMRGASDNGVYKENIVRMSVSLSLGEIWFIRVEK